MKTAGSLTYGFTEADVGLQAFLRDGRNDPAEMRRRLEERFHRAFDRRALVIAQCILYVTIRGVPESLRELLGVYRPQLKVSFPEHLHRVHAGRGGTTR
jgi:hypothetical protein